MAINVDECILASFRGDIDTLTEIAKTQDLSNYYISDWAGNYKFPLWAVPKSLLNIIGGSDWDESWKTHIKPVCEEMEALIRWWDVVYGIDAKRDIEYNEYHECFFCEDPVLTFEDIFYGYDIEPGLKNGTIRSIDLDLFVAAEKFQYDEVERLLRKGANPNFKIDEDYSVFSRIGTECGYLAVQWIDWWQSVYDGHTVAMDNLCLFMRDFIGFAAHERMYNLLARYATIVDD